MQVNRIIGDFRYAIGAHHHLVPLNHCLGGNKLLVGTSYGEVIQFLAIARLQATSNTIQADVRIAIFKAMITYKVLDFVRSQIYTG